MIFLTRSLTLHLTVKATLLLLFCYVNLMFTIYKGAWGGLNSFYKTIS